MLIISVVHQKGGVGKTTLALNLAHCFAENLRVAISDTDLQGSMSEISEFMEGIDLVSLEQIHAQKKLPYDILIIDTPPYLTNKLKEIFLLSDFVLIPTKPGYLDALAIRATIALFNEAALEKKSLQGGIVLNMVMHNTSINEEIKELLDGYNFRLLENYLTHRVSFARSPMTNGIFNSGDEKAKGEVVNVAGEILQILNI